MIRFDMFGSKQESLNRQKGFTLVEVVIAIALFALIALVGWQLVNQLQTTQVRGEASSQTQSELVAFHSSLMSDLKLLAPRGPGALISAEEGSLSFLVRLASPPKSNSADGPSSEDSEQIPPQPVLQRVSYQRTDEGLFRQTMPYSDLYAESNLGSISGSTYLSTQALSSANQTDGSLESNSAQLMGQISELQFTLVPYDQNLSASRGFAQISRPQSAQAVFLEAPSLLQVSFSYQGLSYLWDFALPAYGALIQSASRAQN